jgi:hypothetical protein
MNVQPWNPREKEVMAKPRKDQYDKSFIETLRAMFRTPPKPHKPREDSKIGKSQPSKPESGYKKERRPDGSGRRPPTKD